MQMSARLSTPRLPPSFAALYAEQYGFMWRCARRLGIAANEVEDVVQDSFMVALRRYDEFDHDRGGQVSSWLFAILRNVARNRGRGEQRRQARIDDYAASPRREFTEPEAGTEALLARALLDEFLATLDEDRRAAFILAELEGMTGPELARAIGLNVNTATSRVRAARKAFRHHFAEPRATMLELRRSARRERPDRRAQARSLPAIALAAGYELGAGSGLGAGLLGSKLLAAAVAIGSLIGAGLIVTAEPSDMAPERSGDVALAASDRAALDRAATSTSEPSAAEPPAAEPAPSEPVGAAVRAGAGESSVGSRRSDEPLTRLADAREAMIAGDPRRTLELLAGLELDARLDGRRVALEVAAHCELGEAETARGIAESWRSRHPRDPVAAELVDPCKR